MQPLDMERNGTHPTWWWVLLHTLVPENTPNCHSLAGKTSTSHSLPERVSTSNQTPTNQPTNQPSLSAYIYPFPKPTTDRSQNRNRNQSSLLLDAAVHSGCFVPDCVVIHYILKGFAIIGFSSRIALQFFTRIFCDSQKIKIWFSERTLEVESFSLYRPEKKIVS